jgi:hypothetical protein
MSARVRMPITLILCNTTCLSLADSGFASFLRNIISSTLPSILLSVWQAIVMPIWFYNCAQVGACASLCTHP